MQLRPLRYCLIRQYNNIDTYKFKTNKIKEYQSKNDYIVDIKNNNFNFNGYSNFNFVSNKKFIIENARDNFCVMYIIYRIFDNQIYYGITVDAIEFNPEKDVILYYKEIDLRKKFVNTLIEFYFENRPKDFYDKYEPMYHALFETITGKEPSFNYKCIDTSDFYQSYFFDLPKVPSNFKLTNQNKNVTTQTPVAIRNMVYNKNIEQLLEDTYYNRRSRNDYINEYNNTRVSNVYDINNPESMFFDFDESMTPDLSYMYINNKRFDFSENLEHVQVPKGDFALYYNKRYKTIGIRYVNPMWFDTKKEPNPLLRTYVYIKRLSNKEKNEVMKKQIIDFYTKDHFHLYRLKYTENDIEEMNNVSVRFKDFEKKFNTYKKNYRRRQPVIRNFTDRNNPYIPDYIRYQY